MSTHVVPYGELDLTLRQLVRTGHRIDAVLYRADGEMWHIVTDDAIETRPAGGAA